MNLYRIKIAGTDSDYVKRMLLSFEKGFEAILTHDKNDAAWYEEDVAKIYCEELNKETIDVEFKLEEVEK